MPSSCHLISSEPTYFEEGISVNVLDKFWAENAIIFPSLSVFVLTPMLPELEPLTLFSPRPKKFLNVHFCMDSSAKLK